MNVGYNNKIIRMIKEKMNDDRVMQLRISDGCDMKVTRYISMYS